MFLTLSIYTEIITPQNVCLVYLFAEEHFAFKLCKLAIERMVEWSGIMQKQSLWNAIPVNLREWVQKHVPNKRGKKVRVNKGTTVSMQGGVLDWDAVMRSPSAEGDEPANKRGTGKGGKIPHKGKPAPKKKPAKKERRRK